MKKIFLLTTSILLTMLTSAQVIRNEQVPYIEVTGSAEIEIEPDEIRVEVIIADFTYDKTTKTNGRETTVTKSVSIAAAEKNLMDILKNEGVSKEQILLKATSKGGYSYYGWGSWRYQYNNCAVKMEKRYELVFKTYAQLDKVLQALPSGDEGIVSVEITKLKNKNETEYRKQVKIDAIKAAKEKAQYLLESIGSAVGNPIYVIEVNNDYQSPYFRNANINMLSNSISALPQSGEQNSQMQKIKLRYEIRAQFEIKNK